jgi:hypothetical protein
VSPNWPPNLKAGYGLTKCYVLSYLGSRPLETVWCVRWLAQDYATADSLLGARRAAPHSSLIRILYRDGGRKRIIIEIRTDLLALGGILYYVYLTGDCSAIAPSSLPLTTVSLTAFTFLNIIVSVLAAVGISYQLASRRLTVHHISSPNSKCLY